MNLSTLKRTLSGSSSLLKVTTAVSLFCVVAFGFSSVSGVIDANPFSPGIDGTTGIEEAYGTASCGNPAPTTSADVTICLGLSTILTANGTLGDTIFWYSLDDPINPLGIGNSLSQYPRG